MNTYYIKCIETDYDSLIQLCVKVGIIKVIDVKNEKTSTITQEVFPIGKGSWDYVGKVYDKNSGTDLVSVEETVKKDQTYLGKDGSAYIYVNLRTEVDIMDHIKDIPDLSKFFTVDGKGEIIVPDDLPRVFL